MNINSIQQKTTSIFNEYEVIYAGLFGSCARNQDNRESDIDIMVKLGKPMGMFLYMRFVNDLEFALQRKVDIMTENSMNKHVKPYVMKDIKTIYEK